MVRSVRHLTGAEVRDPELARLTGLPFDDDDILGCIDMILSAEPRADVCTDYDRRSPARLQTMVYAHPAVSSYYKNSAGELPTLFAWRIADYWKWTHRPTLGDYTFDTPRAQEDS